jgi:hypothetical protein
MSSPLFSLFWWLRLMGKVVAGTLVVVAVAEGRVAAAKVLAVAAESEALHLCQIQEATHLWDT